MMKLKKLIQIMLVGGIILVFAACSSKRKSDNVGVNDTGSYSYGAGAGQSTRASGMGDNQNFGDERSSSSRSLVSNRTYYFDFDKSDVHDEDKPAIYANANYLVAHPRIKIILEGHTDPRGSREYNVALGERRAQAVAELLKMKGVNSHQIRIVSYGAEKLAAPGHTEEDYKLDRRAIIVVQK